MNGKFEETAVSSVAVVYFRDTSRPKKLFLLLGLTLVILSMFVGFTLSNVFLVDELVVAYVMGDVIGDDTLLQGVAVRRSSMALPGSYSGNDFYYASAAAMAYPNHRMVAMELGISCRCRRTRTWGRKRTRRRTPACRRASTPRRCRIHRPWPSTSRA